MPRAKSGARRGCLEHRCSMSSRGESRDLSAERPLGRPPAELIARAEPQARGTDASVEFVRLMRTRSTLGDGALRLTRTRSTLGGGAVRFRPARRGFACLERFGSGPPLLRLAEGTRYLVDGARARRHVAL